MSVLSSFDLETFERNAEPAVARYVELLSATLLVWLDVRDRILCTLSAEDGEWCTKIDKGLLKSLKVLHKKAEEYADGATGEGQHHALLFALLSRLAVKHGYTVVVNWSLYPELTNPCVS